MRTLKANAEEKKSKRQSPETPTGVYSSPVHLQKTLPGGIMLMELCFREVYFCVKLYAFEISRLPIGSNVNPQLLLFFTDECDKFKDLTHVHSFAHDFHLRCIQSYISGQQLVFRQGYDLTGFLQDFVKAYPYPPSFSRNYIFEDTITFSNINTLCHQLYDYMLNHDRQYDMKAIRMVPVDTESDVDLEHEYALVAQTTHRGSPEDPEGIKQKLDDYDIGLVICHDGPSPGARASDVEKNTLRLRFYVILTSRRDLFPKLTLEKKLGMFKSTGSKTYYSASPVGHESFLQWDMMRKKPPPVTQHIGVRQEAVNYLGYSNIHQTPIYALLVQEAKATQEKITDMVNNTMAQCRRDVLWQRMLLGHMAEEDSKKKKKNETEDKLEGFTKLTFAEFEELLDAVTRVPVNEVDPKLSAFLSQPIAWYQGLIRVLMLKYSEAHRHFVNVDGQTQYVAVLNPNNLDTFMMLAVNMQSGRGELSAVYREPMLDHEHTPQSPNVPALYMQTHMEGFINACCFHMWTGML